MSTTQNLAVPFITGNAFCDCIVSTKTYLIRVDCINSLASSDKSIGNAGSVSCVAILNSAAIGSNSDHGGLVVNISTTVQPRLLQGKETKTKFLIFYRISNYQVASNFKARSNLLCYTSIWWVKVCVTERETNCNHFHKSF